MQKGAGLMQKGARFNERARDYGSVHLTVSGEYLLNRPTWSHTMTNMLKGAARQFTNQRDNDLSQRDA